MYPRSLADGDGDRIGDLLPGLIDRLGYVGLSRSVIGSADRLGGGPSRSAAGSRVAQQGNLEADVPVL